MPKVDDTIFLNMENGSAIKMNGFIHGNHSFMNGPENIKALSNSKMSLQSLRSNASSTSVNKLQHVNGYASMQSLTDFKELQIFVVMESTDRRFGFSVMGGIDEGIPPKIDNIAMGSPADRTGLHVDDEIIEVNGTNIEGSSHVDIISLIHKCKKDISLKVRRYGIYPSENGQIHEMAIDVPASYRDNNNSYINKTNGEVSSESIVDGPFQYSRLQPKAESANRDSNVPSKFDNMAFERDEHDEMGSMDRLDQDDVPSPKSLAFSQFVTMLEVLKTKLKAPQQQDNIQHFHNLLNTKQFQSAVKTHNKMAKITMAKKGLDSCHAVATNSQFLLTEVRVLLMELNDSQATSLMNIMNKPEVKELLNAHDHIAMRESYAFPENYGRDSDSYDPEDFDEIPDTGEEQCQKIVRIDKTNDPLGATVRNDGDAVIISRIVKGGAAEKSGLLHEGDEILEINGNSVRGRDVNEVVELLSELEGTLTFVLVPGEMVHKDTLREEGITVMKALFDYDPKDDEYLPCEELGLSFRKGDVLEILNQTDPDWWQARFLDTDHNGLAGLIPSRHFQQQRELAKISLRGEDQEAIIKEKKRCWCGRARRKGKKVPMNSSMAPLNETDALTYEDMVRIYPDRTKRRPVVLIGPPQVGRREIREKLISKYPERFGPPVPHTTRVPTDGEVSGADYTFVTKAMFEKAVANAEFIEHGLYNGHYYGTSFRAVQNVIESGKCCLLNLHCQALPTLKTSDLLPYTVFITVPRLDQLKRLREFDDTGEPFNPNIRLKREQLDDIVEKARDMNRTHGHYFDRTIINSDLDRAYEELLETCDYIESEPQWVNSSLVR